MCDPLIEPACIVIKHVIGPAASAAAGDVLSSLAGAVTSGVRWAVTNTAAWWVTIRSPDLAAEPAVTAIQHWLVPVTAAVAAAGVIAAGARMVIARRANPLLDVTGGLLTLAAAVTVGTVVPTLLLKAGDAFPGLSRAKAWPSHATRPCPAGPLPPGKLLTQTCRIMNTKPCRIMCKQRGR